MLPRSLVDAVPGHAPRRWRSRAATSRASCWRSTRAGPGMLDRLCEPGPRIRPFINVFVDGERADMATAVRPASVIHVVPAVAGG